MYPMHMRKGVKVIGFVVVVVVVVVSKKNLQIQILGEFASANCGYGVGNQKKAGVQVSGLSKSNHESYKSCFLLVTPISHTHSNYLHVHTAPLVHTHACYCMHRPYSVRSRTLAIDQYSLVV